MATVEEEPGWREQIAQDVRDLIDRLSGHVLDNAQRAVPVDTGHLHASLRRGIEGTTARIGSDLNYSVYVEEGHRIAYRESAGVTVGETHYVTRGEVVYTGGVVPPQPYLRPALYALKGAAGAVIEGYRK